MAKILIVDDDPDVVEATKIVLEAKGHKVTGAFNRGEGMKAINDVKPDLLILDVIMEQPDDGMAMAQQLRRHGSKVPILMLTSISKVSGLQFDKDNDLLPVDEFVEKPIDPKTLLAKVDQLLAR